MAGKVNWYGPQVFKAVETKARRNLIAATKFLGMDIRRSLQQTKAPPASTAGQVPHYRSQQLARSIVEEVTGLVGRVGPDHTNKYGIYLELGTGPFTITPKTAKALRFLVDGEVRFARVVHHPGIAPRPFLRTALDRNRAKLLRMMSKP